MYRDDREALRGRVNDLESELHNARGEAERARFLEQQLNEARRQIAQQRPQQPSQEEVARAYQVQLYEQQLQQQQMQLYQQQQQQMQQAAAQQWQWQQGITPQPTFHVSSLATSDFGGFWDRLFACLIDMVVLGLLTAMVASRDTTLGFSGATLVTMAYEIAAPVLWGGHIGKLLFGYRLVTADGRRLTWGTSALRYLATFLSALPLGIGYLAVATSDRKQAWHDRIAGTYVVRAYYFRG